MARLQWQKTASRGRVYPALLLAVVTAALTLSVGCGDNGGTPHKGIEISEGGDAGMGDGGADAGDMADATSVTRVAVPVAVETVLASDTVAAGTPVSVDCQLLDADGNQVATPDGADPKLIYSPEQSFIEQDPMSLVPTVAGQATVACQFPSLSLVDDTPAVLNIEPGQPHTVVTTLDTNIVTAGDSATATCAVFDAYGNKVEGADTTVNVDTSGAGIDVNDHTVTITQAGVHTITCSADGDSEERGAPLEVNPALPAHLAISKQPDLPYYDIDQVVSIPAIVTDEYGNQVEDAHVSYDSQPAGQPFGHGRFRYQQEGTYTVTATVDGDTKDDAVLQDSVEIVVDGQGPNIQCVSPADGDMRDAAPGDTVTFRGKVTDAQGVDSVTVNNNPVTVAADGTFEAPVTVRFGINFVDIRATDAATGQYQQENSTTCAFLTSKKWGPEDGFLSDAVSLWVGQESVDDNNYSDPLDSLNDVLHTVLNSNGLHDQLDTSLRANNPLASGDVGCTFLGCLYHYNIEYRGSRLNGPHDTRLTLIQDGMNLHAVVRDVQIDLKETTLGLSGTVIVDSLTGDLDVKLRLNNGRPDVQLQSNSVSVTSGHITIDFNGTPGWLDNIISSLVQGTLKSMIEDQVKNFLQNQLQGTLDNMVSGLDVSALGSTFHVPRLDGSGDLALNFGVDFSSLSTTAARVLFGLGTKFTPAVIERATPSLGVPMPQGDNLLSTDPGRPISAGIHIGTLNQVLHALWRGGLFDASVNSSAIGATFPQGTQIELSTALPPVVALQGPGKLNLMLGAVNMSIVYPGLFDEPVNVRVGAVARTGVSLNGSNLSFQNIQINELYFSPVGITLDSNSRAVLESFLKDLLQNVIDTSLNNALPALPIPSFGIPQSLGQYGLPAGSSLGIVNPALGGTTRHFLLKGDFGVLP